MVIGSIYGPVEISEPALLALLETEAVRRLNGILQHGISGLLGITSRTTRYEHSVGTMLLVRRLGGLLEEQIAALLHDVSHTAFSHVIDFVYGMHGPRSYHEDMKEARLANSDLPRVLAAHGYGWRRFLDDRRYRLLERPEPALCADRLDYFLRDSCDLGLLRGEQVARALAHIVACDGRVAIDDLDTARLLAYSFIAADDASWSNLREVGLYELTARAIQTGLRCSAIDETDIWGTDEALWHKLNHCSDPALQGALRLISPDTRFAWDVENPTFFLSPRVRTIDPDVLQNGRLQRLSAVDPGFARHRRRYLRRKRCPWPIRVDPAPQR